MDVKEFKEELRDVRKILTSKRDTMARLELLCEKLNTNAEFVIIDDALYSKAEIRRIIVDSEGKATIDTESGGRRFSRMIELSNPETTKEALLRETTEAELKEIKEDLKYIRRLVTPPRLDMKIDYDCEGGPKAVVVARR